jgi:MFS family permease
MHKKQPSLITLLLLMPFASVSAVLFTPALPKIASIFDISAGEAQATMTFFLFGYALGNLPYGPIAKRFGRKPTIFTGVSIAILGSILILLSGAYQIYFLFLIGRFTTAIGASVGMKITFTIIGDAFRKAQAVKKTAVVTLAFAIAPSLSIAIGGFLTDHYGWESCFYALLVYCLVLFTLSLFLPETSPHLDHKALNVKKIAATYKLKFSNRKLVTSALMMGCSTSVIYLFASLAPFLGIKGIGLSPEKYGLLNLIPPSGLILGSYFSHLFATRKEKESVMRLGSTIALIMVSLMIVFYILFPLNPWILFAPMPFLYLGTSLVFNNSSSFAMDQTEDKPNGSAIMSFINVFTATIAMLAIQPVKSPFPLFMPLCFAFFIVIQFILNLRLQKL